MTARLVVGVDYAASPGGDFSVYTQARRHNDGTITIERALRSIQGGKRPLPKAKQRRRK